MGPSEGERDRRRVFFGLVASVLFSLVAVPAGAGATPDTRVARETEPPEAPYIGPGAVASSPVGPGRLPELHRDCGFTADLRGDRILWIFCDTAAVDGDGSLVAWLGNTAALAERNDPAHTLDALDGAGRPYPFIAQGLHDPCPAAKPRHSIWPQSATTVPDGLDDHVYVFFEHVCAPHGGDITSVESVSIGVARWTHRPGTPPGGPVQATVLEDDIFGGAWDGVGPATDGGFGRASTYDPATGSIYVYRCHTQWQVPNWGCEVGRAPLSLIANRSAYRFRTAAGTWAPDVRDAAPMHLEGGAMPGSGYQVAWYPSLGRWGLTNMAWPGISDRLEFRVADEPWGPWSPPSTVMLGGGCRATLCYAAYGHPGLSDASSLAFSFYDARPGVEQVQLLEVAIRDHPFWDVTPRHRFAEAIGAMAEAGIVDGYPDQSFRPDQPVTRQAVAAILYRHAGAPWGPQPGCASRPFPDLPTNHPFCGAVRWMVAEGLTAGYDDGTFRPAAPVSRQAAAAFLYRRAGAPRGDEPRCEEMAFADVAADHRYCGAIAWTVDDGIAAGYDDGRFRPTVPVSRQAIAAFLYRFDGS